MSLQGFRVPVVSMEWATQETREFLGNQGHREIPGNGAILAFQGFVTFPCAIRRTTSGNITAKDLTSDDRAARERLLVTKTPKCFLKKAIYCITEQCVTVDSFMTKCVWRTAAQEAETTSLVVLN